MTIKHPFWRCGKCAMRFDVRKPRLQTGLANFSRCYCGLRSFSVLKDYGMGGGSIDCVLPEDLKAHKPNAEVLG